MKISNEIKVGLMAVFAIVTFIWGFNFLRGKDLFSKGTFVYVEYSKVDGLSKSAVVLINGFQVGIVTDIYLKEDGSGKIMTLIKLDKGVKVPKNTVATIVSPDLLSGKTIDLVYKEACSSNCVVSGDTLNGAVRGLVQSMVGDVSIDEYVEKAKVAISAGIDSLMHRFGSEDGEMKESFDDLKATISNLRGVTGQLNNLLAASAQNFNGILTNVESLTGKLSENNQKIDEIISNTADFTAQLKDADLKKTMEGANSAFDKLNTTMDEAEVALGSLKQILDKLNYGDGTASLLINDPKLYNNLNNAMRDLDIFLKDFRLNPKRYVNVSVFGKKGKNYTGVEDDPEGTQTGENLNIKEEKEDLKKDRESFKKEENQ